MATLSKLDKLTYSIGIIDKVTGPVNKVMAKINQLSQQTAAAQDQMMRGAATAVAGGYALARSLAPAIDQAAALGEVKSLGVVDESLQKLNKTSLEFTANFGGNASDFVRSAYDIQSAMSGITGDELSKVTEISNTLAKATKADAATVTDYMGTMYGVFKSTADKMGKVKWAEDIAGITAKAVTDYKTDGKEMASAFSALGASSSAPLAEQIAVMGRLQSTMSGSESATKYKAFEAGAGKAQKALGLDFTDSSGKLLPMVDILQKINEKTNGLTKQADIDAIATAFGSAEASSLIKLLITDIDGLNNQVQDLGSVSGMANVAKMADDMRTPWNKLSGSFNAASIALGQRLLPVVEPFVEMLAAGFAGVVALTEQFPVLSSAIATVIVGVVALMTAFGIATFAMGLYNFATKIGITLANAQIIVNKLWLASLWALRVSGFVALIASMGAAAIAMGTFKAVMLAGQAATWLFNAALWANPITWIVAGVLALIAAVAALIYYFDDITAAFSEWADSSLIFQGLRVAFDLLTLPLQLMWWLIKTIATGIYNVLAPAFSAIGAVFSFLWDVVSGIGGAIAGFFGGIAQGIGGFFSSIWSGAGELISQFVNFLGEKFSFVTNFFSGIGNFIGGIFDRVTGFLKNIADNGILNMVVSFFSDEETVAVKAKVDQTALEPKVAQQKTMVMQSADQAYSRDYGQAVISKATQVPGNTASTNYAAADDAVYSVNKTAAINSVAQLQGNNAVNKINSEITKNDVLNNNAASSATANAHTNAVTTAANDTAYSTSTAMSNATNPTLQNSITTNQTSNTHAQTSALNNSGVNSAVNDAVYSTSTAMSNATNPTLQNSITTNQTSNTHAQTSALNNSGVNSAVNDAVYSTSTAMSNAANPTFQNSIVTNQTDSTLTKISALNNSAINSAVNDAVYSTSTAMSNATNPTLQNSIATNQTHNALTQTSALNNRAVNSVVANAPTNAVIMTANDAVYSTSAKTANINNSGINSAVNDAVYSTSTAMSNAANSTLQNSIATNQSHNAFTQISALNNSAVNSVVANAPTNAVTMAANDAVYSTSAKTANINNSGINSAVNDAVYSTSTAMRNAANSTLQNSIATYQSHNAFTQISALNNSAVNSVVANAPTNAVTMAANDAVYSTSAKTANINNSAINSALQNSSVTHNSAGHIAQSTLFAPQSAPQNTVASTANNFTNAANSPVYSRKHVQVTRVNQGAAPLQPLPVVKTDQAITNVANASAYKVDQLSTEQQQQSNSYKAKVQKSAFLQNLTSNTHNSSSSSDSDNRKSVHIDSLTIKSDDLAQSFEQMMELAG